MTGVQTCALPISFVKELENSTLNFTIHNYSDENIDNKVIKLFMSGKEKDWKEEQWEAQQAILKNRENAGLTKQQLADKYNKIKKNNKEVDDDNDDSEDTVVRTPVKSSSPPAFFASTATTTTTPSSTKAAAASTPSKVAADEDKSFKIPTFKMPWDK